MAITAARSDEPEPPPGQWVLCDDKQLDVARAIAKSYRRSAKQIVEQAILEHLTRPPNCTTCPFYEEVCERAKRR